MRTTKNNDKAPLVVGAIMLTYFVMMMAWLGFWAWAIYTLVTWVVSQ